MRAGFTFPAQWPAPFFVSWPLDFVRLSSSPWTVIPIRQAIHYTAFIHFSPRHIFFSIGSHDDSENRPTTHRVRRIPQMCLLRARNHDVGSADHRQALHYQHLATMRVTLRVATEREVPKIVDLRSAAADRLTKRFGAGHWSGVGTERGVRFEIRNSKVYVAHHKRRLVATLRLTTKKPWAIDRTYFCKSKRPLYLVSMAVTPDLQRQGIGQQCMEQLRAICRRWPADAIRLDAYDAPAGAGEFYAKCGFRNVGRATYRGCPLLYFEWLI